MPVINIPDTIFDNPAFDDLNPTNLTPLGGRLMSSAPHVDGLIYLSAGSLDKDSANLVLTRNGKGDWSLNRTAAGAETYNIRATLGDSAALIRIGEKYNLGGFSAAGVATNYPAAPAKGVQVVDFFAIYKSGVVALTSATLRLGKTVYSNVPAGGAPVQTDLVAATGVNTANNANYGFQDIAVPSPIFHVDDLGLVEIELVVVMANTGTFALAGIGAHINFNFN